MAIMSSSSWVKWEYSRQQVLLKTTVWDTVCEEETVQEAVPAQPGIRNNLLHSILFFHPESQKRECVCERERERDPVNRWH